MSPYTHTLISEYTTTLLLPVLLSYSGRDATSFIDNKKTMVVHWTLVLCTHTLLG